VDAIGLLFEQKLIEVSAQGGGCEGLVAVLAFSIFCGEAGLGGWIVPGSRAFGRFSRGFLFHVREAKRKDAED
jgi:hypothetical protein